MDVFDLGLMDYNQALEEQMKQHERVQRGDVDEALIFCSHPEVVTLGRATKEEDLQSWRGSVVRTSRGGRATYHGPSQLVIYPIFSLDKSNRKNLPKRDVHSYLRMLEAVVVESLNFFEVPAEARTTESVDSEGKKLLLTGVWVGDKKIASIGVAIKKWTTYHGVAINLYKDKNAFKGISPCGFAEGVMASVEEVVAKKISKIELQTVIQNNFKKKLSSVYDVSLIPQS